jgi:hypothetical protein
VDAAPGGGGGGAWSVAAPQAGGEGGNGQITLAWTPTYSLVPFQTLVAHRPAQGSPASLCPMVHASVADQPNGGQNYPVVSLVPGTSARFNGTYTVVLASYHWDSPGLSRQVSVIVTQYEYAGGPSYQTTVSRTITPATDLQVFPNGSFVVVGELTLPTQAIPPGNTSCFYTAGIQSTDLNDQFMDIIFLDTMGQTVIIQNPNTYNNFFIDEPNANQDLGLVLGSVGERAQAVSVVGNAIVSGGPLTIDPGDNTILAYSIEGAPALTITYAPRWFLDRLN